MFDAMVKMSLIVAERKKEILGDSFVSFISGCCGVSGHVLFVCCFVYSYVPFKNWLQMESFYEILKRAAQRGICQLQTSFFLY